MEYDLFQKWNGGVVWVVGGHGVVSQRGFNVFSLQEEDSDPRKSKAFSPPCQTTKMPGEDCKIQTNKLTK